VSTREEPTRPDGKGGVLGDGSARGAEGAL